MKAVSEIDYQVLTALARKDRPVAVADLAAELGLDQSRVTAVCLARAEAGEVTVRQQRQIELRLGSKGRSLAGRPLPERALIQALQQAGGEAEMPQLAALAGLEAREVGQSLRWLERKGWADKTGRSLRLTAEGERAVGGALLDDERLIATLAELGSAPVAALQAERGIDVEAALALLQGRSGVVDQKERTTRLVVLAAAGRSLVDAGIQPRRQVNQLTAELLRTGEWREVELRPYDVTLAAEPVWAGKQHPMVSVIQRTRRVFLELGFTEVQSPYVESSFWDFDALFQPQDHPARDMQDTFYIARPARAALPADELVAAVQRTHEDGGETGSRGWRYRWDRQLATRPVLRTHTTAATIRALATDPRPPRKVFSVGPVFRRETVDYKHLPVFHQVDGIIVDERATFASLLGTLTAFYRKMGFERFQFRPAFFPYTEPSVEIFVWAEAKRDWVEMGGAGVFRPEVTRPVGCQVPVLAWGLGLERLAMFRYQLSSIGELYRARLSWLKETPLCR